MSRKRPGWFRPARPVAVFALDLKPGAATGWHSHPVGQLVHAEEGVMRVVTEAGEWVVPPGRAVWVPPGLSHDVVPTTTVRLRTVYVAREALPGAPSRPAVLAVAPLLRELILRGLELPRHYPLGGAEERLFQVLLDQLVFEPALPVSLPTPTSAPLRRIAAALSEDPADPRTLPAWASSVHLGARTLARRFVDETGLTFGRFRAQLRLVRALELLSAGEGVTEVSLALGYESLSAFISAFRRHFGQTPGSFLRARR